MGHGDLGSFRSTTLTDTSELRAQVTLAGTGCCPSALQKHGPEPSTQQTQSGVIVTLSMSSLTGIARNRAWPSTGPWSCIIALISRAFKLPSNTLGMCTFGRTRRSRSNAQSGARTVSRCCFRLTQSFRGMLGSGWKMRRFAAIPAPTPCHQILPLLLPLKRRK